MTKNERNMFDSMFKRIVHDSRKQMTYLNSGKSGTKYVLVPLMDITIELNEFVNSIQEKGINNGSKK